MWRNYLTVALRSLAKNRTYSLINIVGLAVGMAACLLILLYVRHEASYDEWLPNAENVYQVQFAGAPPGQDKQYMQMAPYPAAHDVARHFPQVAEGASAFQQRPVVKRGAEALFVRDTLVADANFFDVLQLPFARGNRADALKQAGSVVLSQAEAVRLFGTEDVVGRTLTIVNRGNTRDWRVTGVMRDIPGNSSLKIAMVMRLDRADWADNPDALTGYNNINGYGWVRLNPGADAAAVNAAMPAFEAKSIPPIDIGNGQRIPLDQYFDFSLTNIRDVHLGRAQGASMTPGNDARTITTFTVVALLILGMACVNFTNLATARAGQRAREVALRKVLGASRGQLIGQFLGESVMVAAIAMLLGLALAELALPLLSDFLDVKLRLSYVGEGGVLGWAMLLALVVGIAGGAYPAFYLSRFEPAKVLKANRSSADAHGSGWLRSALVVGQFAVSIGLIICTAVVYAQTLHARNSDPGYQREGLLIVEGLSRRQISATTAETLRDRVSRLDGVVAASRTSMIPAMQDNSNTVFNIPGRGQPELAGFYYIDPHYLDTMKLPLVAGRNLGDANALDRGPANGPEFDKAAQLALQARGINMLVNETAARKFGFANPRDAVGKVIGAGLTDPAETRGGWVPATIIGVVRDARFRSVRDNIEPLTFFYTDGGHDTLVVRFRGDPNTVRERIGAAWRDLIPDVPFEAQFAEDAVAELYRADQARGTIFAVFAGLSVLVGCLGLFGLAAFTTERRTREIGIRKVLGARTRDIVRLMLWQFSKPVAIANIIAWPVAWWLMRDWLDGFSDRIGLGPQWFVGAGALALLIACATIIGHTLKVARAKPVLALRYE